MKHSNNSNNNSLKGDLEIMNPDKKNLNKDNNEIVMYEELFSNLYEIPLSYSLLNFLIVKLAINLFMNQILIQK